MSNLFLDIETVCMIEPTESDLKAPGQYKKPEAIQKYIDDNKDDLMAKEIKDRSVDIYENRIICLGYAFNSEKPVAIVSDTEESILKLFQEVILEYCNVNGGSPEGMTLIGHNIKNFDAPSIYLKACKYGLNTLQSVFYFGRKNLVDTMILGSYSKYNSFISMDKLCRYFGFAGKEGMDGSKVYQAWKDGKIDEIADYCCKDVENTRKLEKILMP